MICYGQGWLFDAYPFDAVPRNRRPREPDGNLRAHSNAVTICQHKFRVSKKPHADRFVVPRDENRHAAGDAWVPCHELHAAPREVFFACERQGRKARIGINIRSGRRAVEM